MSTAPHSHDAHGDSHGHDAHGHGDAHGHDAHGHDAHEAAAPAPAPAPAPEPLPPPINPATKEQELGILQACFHIATRSSFVYFSEPGSLLVRTAEDRRLQAVYETHATEDGTYADRIALLVRERGTEPSAHAFPEKFTRMNFLTFESIASHFAEDLASHVAVLERLAKLVPPNATPSVAKLVQDFAEERKKHLTFWSAEAKRYADAAKARLAKKPAPAKKH